VTFGFFDGTLEELERSQAAGDYEDRRAAIEPYVDDVIANGIYEVEIIRSLTATGAWHCVVIVPTVRAAALASHGQGLRQPRKAWSSSSRVREPIDSSVSPPSVKIVSLIWSR
jgi:hypothetical protein